MNVLEQRETIIKENNTAQNALLDIIDTINKRTDILDIREPLHGDLDLRVLTEHGFQRIKKIIFHEGEITSINNIPEGITSLNCPNNLLSSLNGLPSSLLQLEIPYNYISKLDFTDTVSLQQLNISHNRFENIDNINVLRSLEELDCQSNSIQHLNLQGLSSLRTLNVSNNKITIIENLTETIVDFLYENNPSIDFRNSNLDVLTKGDENEGEEENIQQKMNYVDALHRYFNLKTTYEKKVFDMKKQAFKAGGKKQVRTVKPPCVSCKRPVGSIFSLNNKKYTAICGDAEKPCRLQIELFKGEFESLESYLYEFKDEAEAMKTDIICEKLDTLFSYVDEKQSIPLFKRLLDKYNVINKFYTELMEKHTELHASPHKAELVQRKKDMIFILTEKINGLLVEYGNTRNRELLKAAVELQVNELHPEIRNLRLFQHEVMEMNLFSDSTGAEIFKYGLGRHLFQNDVALTKLEHTYGEPQRVIKYSFGK